MLARRVSRIFLNHLGAGHVAGHQVGRELNPLERQMQRAGQRADQQRLGQARHAFQQRMAAGEHRDQHLLDHFALADDDLRQLVADAVVRFLAMFERRRRRLDCHLSLVSCHSSVAGTFLVPTLRVGTRAFDALRRERKRDAERPTFRSHGDRGNES